MSSNTDKKVGKSTGRNFMKEYPTNGYATVYPPRLMIRSFILLCFAPLLLILNLLMLGVFASTFAVRRFFHCVGLVHPRRQIRKLKIKSFEHRTKTQIPRVCVIGCGPSGLVVVKECLENGLEVVAYDSKSEIGGTFSCSYEDGLMTSSNFFTAFLSFPCNVTDLPSRFWSFEEYKDYLRKFVTHFGLEDSLNLGYKVSKVTETEDKKWKVEVIKCSTMEEFSSIFDNIVVCSGTHQIPFIPEHLTSSSYEGDLLHSSDYRSAKPFAGNRVLIVGMGESASDIAFNVSKEASNVCIIARSGPGFVVPRFHAGMPTDTDSTRIYYSVPRSLGRWSSSWWKFKVWLESFYNLKEDDEIQKILKEVNYSKYHWMFRYATKSTNFALSVTQKGGQYMETSIQELDRYGATMENGSRYDCDAIIFCSGFKSGFSFLPPDLANVNYRNDLWKKCIHPRFGKRIAFVGFVRPNIGAIPPLFEMQARFLALALADRIQLPSQEEMRKTIEEERANEEWLFPTDFKRVPSLCSYLETLTSWARILDCDVNYWSLVTRDPLLLYYVIFGPILPVQYRLFGEGSDYEKARKSLCISGTSPLVPSLYTSLVLLSAAVLSNFGLCDPPIAFPLP